jgi:hypothetical protein
MNKNLKDFTYCKDSDCKIKEHCFRFNDQNPDEYFTESPRTDNKCAMFWGEQQENITSYMNEAMTEMERSNYGEAIYGYLLKPRATLARIGMEMMVDGRSDFELPLDKDIEREIYNDVIAFMDDLDDYMKNRD